MANGQICLCRGPAPFCLAAVAGGGAQCPARPKMQALPAQPREATAGSRANARHTGRARYARARAALALPTGCQLKGCVIGPLPTACM